MIAESVSRNDTILAETVDGDVIDAFSVVILSYHHSVDVYLYFAANRLIVELQSQQRRIYGGVIAYRFGDGLGYGEINGIGHVILVVFRGQSAVVDTLYIRKVEILDYILSCADVYNRRRLIHQAGVNDVYVGIVGVAHGQSPIVGVVYPDAV